MGASQQSNQERGCQGFNIHDRSRSKSITPAAGLQPVKIKNTRNEQLSVQTSGDWLPATGTAVGDELRIS
jgi:hypothetical protein